MLTKSYAAKAATAELEPFEFPRRKTSANDIRIEIEFCGLCHSDIHTARNEWKNTSYPCVPGHEIIGKVIELGAAVKSFNLGQRVGVGCMVDSCKTCSHCKAGEENYCLGGLTGTYNSPHRRHINEEDMPHTLGGYSSQIVVDQEFVLRLPEGMDPAASAPLLCAGITTYSPLKKVGLKKDDKLAVMGLGGLGHMAVKIGAAMGAEVTVLSRSPSKEKDAQRLGASHFVLTSGEMSPYRGHFDYILDTVSAAHDLGEVLSLLKLDGTLIMVGVPEKPLALATIQIIAQRRKIMGSLIGGIRETQEMLDFCAKHDITSDIELIAAKDINAAYERTLSSDVKYRFVLDCKTL